MLPVAKPKAAEFAGSSEWPGALRVESLPQGAVNGGKAVWHGGFAAAARFSSQDFLAT